MVVGHAEAILSKLDSEVSLIGFDRDVDALATANKRLANYGSRVALIHDSYANLDRHLDVARMGKSILPCSISVCHHCN